MLSGNRAKTSTRKRAWTVRSRGSRCRSGKGTPARGRGGAVSGSWERETHLCEMGLGHCQESAAASRQAVFWPCSHDVDGSLEACGSLKEGGHSERLRKGGWMQVEKSEEGESAKVQEGLLLSSYRNSWCFNGVHGQTNGAP